MHVSSKQISWNGLAKTKCYGHHKFWGLANLSSMDVVPTCTPQRLPASRPLANTVSPDSFSPLLISWWKTLSRYSCNWHFSGVNSECFRAIVFSFTGTIFISFVHVSGGLLSFFLPLLYIGCRWKICFSLASLPQPVGSFWNSAVKREFCLRIVKPAFQHHWPNTGLVTIILLRGQTLGGRSCRGLYWRGYIQKKVYLLSQCV